MIYFVIGYSFHEKCVLAIILPIAISEYDQNTISRTFAISNYFRWSGIVSQPAVKELFHLQEGIFVYAFLLNHRHE